MLVGWGGRDVNGSDCRGKWLVGHRLGEVCAFSEQQDHGDVVMVTAVVGGPNEVGANPFVSQVRGEEKSDLVVIQFAGETVRTEQQSIAAPERKATDRNRESARAADRLEKYAAIGEAPMSSGGTPPRSIRYWRRFWSRVS